VIARRTFLYGQTLGTLATSLSAEAQEAGKVCRIAHVSPVDLDRPEPHEAADQVIGQRVPAALGASLVARV